MSGSAGSVIGSAVWVALRRVVLYPTLLIGGGSLGIDEAKKRIPDMPDLGPVGEAASTVTAGILELLRQGEDKLNAVIDDAKEVVEKASPTKADTERSKSSKHDTEEAERLLGEINRLRRQVALLEDAADGNVEEHQSELLKLTTELSTEIERLTADNTSLRRRLVIDSAERDVDSTKSVAELYSDILALREDADGAFRGEDQLPRVVVVGDQSAGKTSVLEMIARARIFPRGAGEMMTRAPVQVTMSDADEPTANLKGQSKIYRTDSEASLALLRAEIEKAMMRSVADGHSVSDSTISLDIRGPGLRPMVLVDLPGIIQHHTVGMHDSTKDSILGMCKHHINNPNAIIMCVQDATRDAEGSSVADLVRTVDPDGERTIFVLTKVDLAEKMQRPAKKLEQILKGQVYNMQARNYFAVVTGTEDRNATIEDICQAERRFFERSTLFMTGVVKASSMGTSNLSRAVSKAFWEIVHRSVGEQLDTACADLKRKENEWKARFSGQPRVKRQDLFIVGRHKILESISSLNSSLTAIALEKLLREQLWERIREYVIDTLYVGSADNGDPGSFRANCENLLSAWSSQGLAAASLGVARDTLISEMEAAVDFPDEDGTFTPLKKRALETCAENLVWGPNTKKKLQSIQDLRLSDDVIPDDRSWKSAAAFMHQVLSEEHARALAAADEAVGPSTLWQWMSWTRLTPEQKARAAAFAELATFFPLDGPARPSLNREEANGIKLSVSRRLGTDVTTEFVHETYNQMHRIHFLNLSTKSAQYCSGRYYKSEEENTGACNGLACSDVLLFWRLQNMMASTSNVLRVEAMDFRNTMEDELRSVLADIQGDTVALQAVLRSPKLDLAEEIEMIKLTMDKLKAFEARLRTEGKVPNAKH